MNEDREKILKNENTIWFIYVLFAIAGIYANNLEIEDFRNKSERNKKRYKTINIIIIIIALLINIYFINLTYHRYNRTRKTTDFLISFAATLVLIANIIFFFVEISSDEIIPNDA